MACLFAGHLAGNCDAAGDTWPVIHSSTASVFSGDPSSLGLARLRHAADLGRRSRLPAPLGAERRIRRGGGTGSSGLNERWTRRGKRRFIAVETLSKSGLSMGVPLVERLTSLSNSLRRLRGLKPKDLVGIQWRVAFGQQDEGWCLRRDNV
jgi:hypothetical protein